MIYLLFVLGEASMFSRALSSSREAPVGMGSCSRRSVLNDNRMSLVGLDCGGGE